MADEDRGLPDGVHTVAIGLGDLNGVMRGKRVPAERWAEVRESGIALSIAVFACDMTSDVWDTPYVNMENGYPDMHVVPTGEVYPVPWEEGCAFSFGRAIGMDHKPVPIDPRGALEDQVSRAEAMGYQVRVGAELEFYLLDPETGRPVDVGNQFYGLVRAAELEHVIGPIRRHLPLVGIPLEQSNPEYAAGQVEVNIRYGEILRSADQVVAFRSFVKEIAAQHGFLATFMSKPFAEESGNGFHAHYSLWKDGENAFASDGGGLSGLGMAFLGGLQQRMVESALAVATTPNAYKRRRPYTFCPVNNCWGRDNRTVGLRIIDESPAGTRVEKRDGSADCNPYYLMAADLAAGLDGIESGVEPRHFMDGDGYQCEAAEVLPRRYGYCAGAGRELGFPPASIGGVAVGDPGESGEARARPACGPRHVARDRPVPPEFLMRIARITGRVSASIKAGQLSGHRMLIADCIAPDGKVLDTGIVLTDACDAGPGDIVLVATGSAARIAGSTAGVPTDATAVAVVDHMSMGSSNVDLNALRQGRPARGK